MSTMRELKTEIAQQVEASLVAGEDIDIAGVHITVLDLGDAGVYVDGLGRLDRPSTVAKGSVFSVTAQVLARVKARFREEGPGAALRAVKGK